MTDEEVKTPELPIKLPAEEPISLPVELPKTKKSRRSFFDRVAAGEEVVPWTVKPMQDIAKTKTAEELARETLELQSRAIWLAWKIIYHQDLGASSVVKRAEAARKLVALTIDHPMLKKLIVKKEKDIKPVKVEFNKKNR
jgi:hypothetical protein